MKKAIIIGASSGIGRELSKILSNEQYTLGLTARRAELLDSLCGELGGCAVSVPMDIANTEEALQKLDGLIGELGGIDLVVVSAGIGYLDPEIDWKHESETIDVNVKGFTCIADAAINYFLKQGYGHLVGISSVAALRGSRFCPAYSASKAFMSNYLDGLRYRVQKVSKDIAVTDIKPGFVDTRMAQGKLFWVASPGEAARQIYNIIRRKKRRGYVTKRWGFVAWLVKIAPDWLYSRI